jgi:hypothetical protein
MEYPDRGRFVLQILASDIQESRGGFIDDKWETMDT